MSRRKVNIRPISGNFSTYILVDGESEQDYLNSIKKSEKYSKIIGDNRVKISPDIPNRKSLSDQFNYLKEALNDYDRVIWLVDYDVINQQAMKHGKKSSPNPRDIFKNYRKKLTELCSQKKYEGKEVHVLINNPSIEYWYLLHYKNTTKLYLSSGDAERDLCKFLKQYTKNDAKFRCSILNILEEKIEDAIKNAKKIKIDEENIQARADIFKIFDDKLALLSPPKKKNNQ